jgi:hypothetical protein
MADDHEWESVEIGERRAISSSHGRVTIQWRLVGGFTREWAWCFRPSGSKKGSPAFVTASGDPHVDMTEVVTWQVPEGDLAGADSFVKSSIEATNDAYRLQLDREGQTEPERRARETAEAEHLDELQRRLDELD